MNIGIAIRYVRQKYGITKGELSNLCDISQASLSQIENNIKRPSLKTIEKICTALDIPEVALYIIAIEEADVAVSKREVYRHVHPSISSLILQIVGPPHSVIK